MDLGDINLLITRNKKHFSTTFIQKVNGISDFHNNYSKSVNNEQTPVKVNL